MDSADTCRVMGFKRSDFILDKSQPKPAMFQITALGHRLVLGRRVAIGDDRTLGELETIIEPTGSWEKVGSLEDGPIPDILTDKWQNARKRRLARRKA